MPNEIEGTNVKEHMTKTIDLLDTLVNTEGIFTEQQRADMYTAQICLIDVFGPADIRHNLNEEE